MNPSHIYSILCAAAGRLTQAPFPPWVPATVIGSVGGPIGSAVAEVVACVVLALKTIRLGARLAQSGLV